MWSTHRVLAFHSECSGGLDWNMEHGSSVPGLPGWQLCWWLCGSQLDKNVYIILACYWPTKSLILSLLKEEARRWMS